jgi:hypothetical protein
MKTFLTIAGSVVATLAVLAAINRVPAARQILGN